MMIRTRTRGRGTGLALKVVGGVTVVVLGVALAGGPASAGEWSPGRERAKGDGYIHGPDESGAHPARSECAYSGRDDPDPEDDDFWGAAPSKGRVQSPGQVVALLGRDAAGIPGMACRGNAGH